MKVKESVLVAYFFVLPLTIIMAVFLIYPTLLAIYISFTDQRVLGGPSHLVGLEPYIDVFLDPKTYISIGNTFLWLIGNLIILVLGGLAGALILNQEFRGKWFVRSILLLPWMVPTTAIAWIARWMLSSELGVINNWLTRLMIIDQPINFLGSTQNSMLSCILVNAWRFIPFNILLIYAALQTIPEDLYEAANIDGASAIQIFRYITLPFLGKILTAVTLLSIIWITNYFDFPWLLTGGGPALSTETIPIRLYRLAFQSYDFCNAAALSVTLFLGLSIFAYLYIRRVKPF